MYLRRFRGETVREALARARAGLGSEALVLSTQMVPASGLRGLMGAREVEITAALEREMSEVRPLRQPDRPIAPGHAAALVARLEAAGFESGVAAAMAAGATRTDRRASAGPAVRRAVADWLAPFAAVDEPLAAVEVFVGPPGAGKTTTIAKIAAQARVRDGARLRLVSTDDYRPGAIEQLRQYADVIGSPFVAATNADAMARTLSQADAPVLIDTAGRSPRDAQSATLAALRGAPGVRTHLVVPAGSSARDIARLLPLHADSRPDRLVLTKIDEVEATAELAAVLRDSGLRVSYLGHGQRVPEDLCRATPVQLAAALLGELITEHAA